MAQVIKADPLHAPGIGRYAPASADAAGESWTLLADARRQAAEILAEAKARAADQYRQAGDQGYAEGFARGRSDGCAEGIRRAREEGSKELSDRTAELSRQMARVVETLAEACGEVRREAQRHMLRLAVRLAERIVGLVASRDVSAAEANLRKALELAGRPPKATVLVNPGQLEALRLECESFLNVAGGSGVELVAEAGVSPGGAKVLVQSGEIDATIETQLDNVARALLGEGAP